MIFDIGDKVWHIEENIEVTIIEISDNPDRFSRTYSLAQTEAQVKKYGKVNWVAWLSEKDLREIKR
jgi:hypothetical protein